jgi:hypothetical protein
MEKNKSTKKVLLGVPCTETVRSEFAQCLAGLTQYNAQHFIDSSSCFITSSVLHDSRNKMIMTMFHDSTVTGCEWIVFIDSDMVFPNNAVERLITHSPHVKVVGVNYCSRIEPYNPTCRKFEGFVYTTSKTCGLEEIETMGMGMVAIHRDVIETLEMPYFDWVTGKKSFIGEDVYFFNRVRQCGFSVYVDHDLSKEIYHIGSVRLSNSAARPGEHQIKTNII